MPNEGTAQRLSLVVAGVILLVLKGGVGSGSQLKDSAESSSSPQQTAPSRQICPALHPAL